MISQHNKFYFPISTISLVVDIKFQPKVHFHSAAMFLFW